MKPLLLILIIFTLWANQAVQARTVEIDVHGMTCAFCVDSLQRIFSKLKSVFKVDISLKQKKIRLITDENLPDIKTIRQTVIDAGFTPTKITVQQNETGQQ